MANWLVLLLILIFSFLLGSLIVLQFVPLRTQPQINLVFAALTLGVGVSGWLALLLAEMGLFSLPSIAFAWLAAACFLLLLVWLRRKEQDENPEDRSVNAETSQLSGSTWSVWLEVLILAAWIITAGWLFFRPHEYIMGGADAGVYISLGAEIAQNGGFQIFDDELAALDEALQSAMLRPLPTNPIASSYLVPGFYVADAKQGVITPQFYPLHPLWLATAFALTGSIVEGIYAELLMSGLWMALATLAIYLTVREIAGRLTAVLVLAAFSVTALQVWFARYSATEALTQYLLWAGLWGLAMWLGGRRPASLWAFLSGLMLGSVFLVRIDVLVMLPIFALLVVALWARGWERSTWWFVIPLVLLVAHSFVHGLWLSAPYFYEHIGFGMRILWRSWLVPVLVVLGGVVFISLLYFFRGRFAALRRFQRPFKLVLITLILISAIYGWFIRPYTADPILVPDAYSQSTLLLTNHENLLRLGWYIFPTGIWLGVLGSCLLVWHVEKKTAVLLAVGLLFSVLYLWDVRANPHHVYVMRRFVPAVLPLFLISGAYLAGWLVKWSPAKKDLGKTIRFGIPILGIIVAAIWLGGLAWSNRGFVRQVDHRGVVDQLTAIESELRPNSVLIFNDQSPVGLGDIWGTPLKFIFNHDVFTLRDPEILHDPRLVEMIEIWQNNGRPVVWIGDSSWLDENGFPYLTQSQEIHSQRLESSYEHKPQEIVPVTWILPMSQIKKR
jgi:hypothetical protein